LLNNTKSQKLDLNKLKSRYLTLKVTVTNKPHFPGRLILDTVDAHVDDRAAFLDHMSLDEPRNARRHDDDVCVLCEHTQLFWWSVPMTDCGCGVTWEVQIGGQFTYLIDN